MTGEIRENGASERRQFQLHACLGRGGFGEVYRATMVSSGGVRTEVAVKVMHADVGPDSQAVSRLRDEGRLLDVVRHPVVLKVYDLVLLDGRVGLVTEYVEGQDLDKSIQGGDPPTVRAMLEIIAKVSDALRSAYTTPAPGGQGQLQLVHRDIKPANIRLGRHGDVKLLDFGIARAANVSREAKTETDALLGSYLYMAPERFLERTDAGPAVDIYALGLILFEGITRRRLFGDKTLKELYLLVLDGERYDTYIRKQLEIIPKGVPHQISALIYRVLDLDPGKRPDHDTLTRTCHDIAERLPGATLDKWARSRIWPPVREVRGVLDGAVITESAFGSSGASSRASLGGTPAPQPARELTASRSVSLDLKTITATLDRPSVVAAAGVGLFGVVSVVLSSLLFALLGVIALWCSGCSSTPRPPSVRPPSSTTTFADSASASRCSGASWRCSARRPSATCGSRGRTGWCSASTSRIGSSRASPNGCRTGAPSARTSC